MHTLQLPHTRGLIDRAVPNGAPSVTDLISCTESILCCNRHWSIMDKDSDEKTLNDQTTKLLLSLALSRSIIMNNSTAMQRKHIARTFCPDCSMPSNWAHLCVLSHVAQAQYAAGSTLGDAINHRCNSSVIDLRGLVLLKTAKMSYFLKCACDHPGRFILDLRKYNKPALGIGVAYALQMAWAVFDVHSLRHLWRGWMFGGSATHCLFQRSRRGLEKYVGVQLLHVSQKDLAETDEQTDQRERERERERERLCGCSRDLVFVCECTHTDGYNRIISVWTL